MKQISIFLLSIRFIIKKRKYNNWKNNLQKLQEDDETKADFDNLRIYNLFIHFQVYIRRPIGLDFNFASFLSQIKTSFAERKYSKILGHPWHPRELTSFNLTIHWIPFPSISPLASFFQHSPFPPLPPLSRVYRYLWSFCACMRILHEEFCACVCVKGRMENVKNVVEGYNLKRWTNECSKTELRVWKLFYDFRFNWFFVFIFHFINITIFRKW